MDEQPFHLQPFPAIDSAKTPKELADAIVEKARDRKAYGSLDSLADFIAGAATVLQYLWPGKDGTLSECVPPIWPILMMCGRGEDIIKEHGEDVPDHA